MFLGNKETLRNVVENHIWDMCPDLDLAEMLKSWLKDGYKYIKVLEEREDDIIKIVGSIEEELKDVDIIVLSDGTQFKKIME